MFIYVVESVSKIENREVFLCLKKKKNSIKYWFEGLGS